MTKPVPDTSPDMLSIYLQARIHVGGADKRAARAAVARVVKRDADISHMQFNAAVAGRRLDAATTARIWRALGVDTSSASRAEGAPAGPRDGSDGRSALRASPGGADAAFPPASAAKLKGGADR